MTAVIRRQHEWPVRWQPFAALDGESMCHREANSQHRKTSMVRETFDQTALPSHAAKALAWRQAGVAGRLKFPRLHGDFLSAKDLLLLVHGEADKIIHVMKYSGRHKNQTIEAVENAAVTGNEF